MDEKCLGDGQQSMHWQIYMPLERIPIMEWTNIPDMVIIIFFFKPWPMAHYFDIAFFFMFIYWIYTFAIICPGRDLAARLRKGERNPLTTKF